MIADLITAEQYATLPEDPELKFAEIERICRNSLANLLDDDNSNYNDLLRIQYMMTVSTAAEELEIRGISLPDDLDRPYNAVNNFMLDVSKIITRIRLRSSSGKDAESVRLSNRNRAKIELQIRKLRTMVEASDLPQHKREALFKKLDEFSVALTNPRLSFGRTFAILGYVALGLTTGTSFFADAPEALATIASIIGADKEAEEAELQRLGPPPVVKALPAPKQTPAPAFDSSSDDDIPF